MFRRHIALAVFAFVSLLPVALIGQAAPPDVLKKVPNDAQVVIVVKNLKEFSNKLSNYATRLGVPGQRDFLSDASEHLGITKGLDPNGSLALVLMTKPEKSKNPQPPAVVLVPTTDAKALLEPFQPTDPVDGISDITVPNSGDTGYASIQGSFVVLAQDKAAMTQFLQKKPALDGTLDKDSVDAFSNNDVVLYANVTELSKEFLPQLDQMKQGLEMLLSMAQQQNQAITKGILDAYFDSFRQFLTDANAGVVSLNFTDAGVTLGLRGNFKADSPTAKLISAQPVLKSTGLAGLPAGNILFAATAAVNGQSLEPIISSLTQVLMTAMGPTSDDPKMKQYMQDQKDLVALMTGARVVLFAPTDESQGFFRGADVIDTADSDAYIKLLHRTLAYSTDNPIMRKTMPGIKVDYKLTENATPVKGIKLDKFVAKFSLDEATTKKANDDDNAPDGPPNGVPPEMLLEQIKSMYGPDGLVMNFGKIGPKTVLMTMGSDPAMIADAVDAAQNNTDNLGQSAEIKSVQTQVLPNSMFVGYLPVDRIAEIIMHRMMQMQAGGAAPARPKNAVAMGHAANAPVVFSIAANTGNLQAQVFVPISTILNIAAMGQSAMQGEMAPPPPMQAPQ